MTAREYLGEKIVVGGIETTKGEFIAKYQRLGIPQQCIDAYLIGSERRKNE